MKYQIILADPPWPVKKIIRRVRPNQTEMDYPTMSVEAIQALPVASIADANATLWLWTTHKFLPLAFDVMAAWGFHYQRTITWDKGNGMCLFGFHNRTEFLLFGYKGKLEMYPRRRAVPTLFIAPSPRHSEKPPAIRLAIETFGAPRIELFARQKVAGWTCLGNAISGRDIREDLQSIN